ncbi:MAG: SpoIIE family protein phosphatase [Deltaproteobacteria bacterium]|nr:SpoIIE family protein phosphatase [Deltaproteobacteria bacterium]MBW2072198.1 SpoIIE family protein phosphatase [Deltaproteobacteria bacterium]
MIRTRSLQQRLLFFLLLPVTLLLVAMGIVGFLYARNILFAEWQEAAILKLQRAAHDVDMRLDRPRELLDLFHKTGGIPDNSAIQSWILEQLQGLEGVARVALTTEGSQSHMTSGSAQGSQWRMSRRGRMTGKESDTLPSASEKETRGKWPMMMRFHRGWVKEITPPRFDSLVQHETVSIISELSDSRDRLVGKLEVTVRFDYLVKNVVTAGWWQSNQAFLVDDTGRVLMCTDHTRKFLGENKSLLELATLSAMKEKSWGTVFGKGHPPDEVSGFYRLEKAPWSIVLIAPGDKILEPIVRFRTYYTLTGSVFILAILLLIRWVTRKPILSIKEVSEAADRIAHNDFSSLPSVRADDEVGQLIRNFNTMVVHLEERLRLKEALTLAMEVQQNLLPATAPQVKGVDIAGTSIYCDETGGDYYDFLEFSPLSNGRLGVTVGDVAGHGVSAALLMTTVRALLRSRVAQGGRLGQLVTDVNRLLALDTSASGNFMTLFFTAIDPENSELEWVRAGHEPALLYDPAADSFVELRGDGIALGIDEEWSFQENSYADWHTSQIILIGTDGIWETENSEGEMYGKARLRAIIRRHKESTAQELVQAIIDELSRFRGKSPQTDDITLVVLKKQ